MGNKLGTFLLGGAIGAAIALLYAPRTGVEARAAVSDKMNEAWGNAQDFGVQAQERGQQIYQNAQLRGQQVCQSAQERGQAVYESAHAAAQEAAAKGQDFYVTASSHVANAADSIKPVFTEKNDELREKIEAARQRIATQVVKNAEDAQEKIPVAVDAAKEVVDKAKDYADLAGEKASDMVDAVKEKASEASEKSKEGE